MAEIHPTAIVDSKAEIDGDVTIGPYCVVAAGVRIGAGSQLQSHVVVEKNTIIGPHNRFYSFCSVGQQTQDLKYREEPTYLEIGEGNCFREFCTLNRGTAPGARTVIGSRGNFLAYTHIAHDCVVGDGVIFSNNATLAGHVTVEDEVIVGGFGAVHQFCRLGRHCIIGGHTKVVQDIPPYMVADGHPAKVRGLNLVGLKRRGFSADSIRIVKELYRFLYRRQLNTQQALEKISAELEQAAEVAVMRDFIEHSERGLAPGGRDQSTAAK